MGSLINFFLVIFTTLRWFLVHERKHNGWLNNEKLLENPCRIMCILAW